MEFSPKVCSNFLLEESDSEGEDEAAAESIAAGVLGGGEVDGVEDVLAVAQGIILFDFGVLFIVLMKLSS
jgi:hypothetical protein